MKKPVNWKTACIGMILLQSILYGVLDATVKLTYRVISAQSFLLLRYIIAAAFLFLFWRKTILQEVCAVPLKKYIVPCICMGSAFVISNIALSETAATNVSFLRSLTALMVPVLTLLFFKTRYTLRTLILQMIMLAGLYLLCAKGGLSQFGRGEILALVAAALVAGALVFGRDSLQYVSAVTLSFMQSACSIVVCFVWGISDGLLQQTRWELFLMPLHMTLLLYAALGCTVGGYMLQNISLQHISARMVGILQCTQPVVSACLAYVILEERLSAAGMIGAAIILTCVLLESILKEEAVPVASDKKAAISPT